MQREMANWNYEWFAGGNQIGNTFGDSKLIFKLPILNFRND